MVIEHPVPPFLDWIALAALKWVFAIGVLVVLTALVGLVMTLVRRGPGRVFPVFWSALRGGAGDLVHLSWRRVLAIARLMIQESIRKKVVVIAVVFLILLMFAGWFIDPTNKNPGTLYLNFVLTTTDYLVLLLVLFLSTLSLPAEFKSKTIFTVVTKPVRASEIILGRILGLAAVGTAILAFMAFLSYFFVSMSLNHTHTLLWKEDIVPEAVAENAPADAVVARGKTQVSNGHFHEVEEYADGTISLSEENNHTHTVKKIVDGENIRYVVGPQRGTVQAKVPIYGKIRFLDSGGYEKEAGISVGEEWEYRSYIGGATSEAVIWTFDGLSEKRLPNGLPVEMTISVYRSHKGDIERTIMGALLVRNPATGLTAEIGSFNSEKYRTLAIFVPREINRSKVRSAPTQVKRRGGDDELAKPFNGDPAKENYDLYADFCDDGRLEIWIQCVEDGQYFGAAEPDLYIRTPDANVFFNFFKGYFGIWQQMLILLSFGILFSTFLSGPVAMFSTFGVMIAAFCRELLMNIAFMRELGGGPFEAWERLITHENLMSDLSNTFGTYLIKFFDLLASGLLCFIGMVIPSFTEYDIYTNYVASGFNIPFNTLAVHGLTTLAYVAPLFVVAYLILRGREVAK